MYLVYADFGLQSCDVLLVGAAEYIRHSMHWTISVRCRPCIFHSSEKRRGGTSRFIGFAVSIVWNFSNPRLSTATAYSVDLRADVASTQPAAAFL